MSWEFQWEEIRLVHLFCNLLTGYNGTNWANSHSHSHSHPRFSLSSSFIFITSVLCCAVQQETAVTPTNIYLLPACLPANEFYTLFFSFYSFFTSKISANAFFVLLFQQTFCPFRRDPSLIWLIHQNIYIFLKWAHLVLKLFIFLKLVLKYYFNDVKIIFIQKYQFLYITLVSSKIW